MSEKQAKRHRRQQRRLSQALHQPTDPTTASLSGGEIPPPSRTSSSHPSPVPDPFSSSPLAIALYAAIPLRIVACYERGGPHEEDWELARQFGAILAERGDRLLFRGEQEGETADLFNQLAESIAILSFVPEGIPSLFGQRYDAQEVLAGFFGAEEARAYCQRFRSHSPTLSPIPLASNAGE